MQKNQRPHQIWEWRLLSLFLYGVGIGCLSYGLFELQDSIKDPVKDGYDTLTVIPFPILGIISIMVGTTAWKSINSQMIRIASAGLSIFIVWSVTFFFDQLKPLLIQTFPALNDLSNWAEITFLVLTTCCVLSYFIISGYLFRRTGIVDNLPLKTKIQQIRQLVIWFMFAILISAKYFASRHLSHNNNHWSIFILVTIAVMIIFYITVMSYAKYHYQKAEMNSQDS